jgi:signal transduction histidine kinase
MEIPPLAVYRAILLVAFLFGIVVLYRTILAREKPGSRPLALLVFGALLYIAVKLVVSTFRGTPTVFLVTRLNPLAAGLATVGFFIFVIEYTGIQNPISKRNAGLLLIEPVIINSLVWIDISYLWIPRGPDPGTLSGYSWEITSIAVANQLYMNILLLVAIGLLIRFAIQSATVFRMQAVALGIAAIGPMMGNLAYYFDVISFNLAPIMFVLSATFIITAIFTKGFLDLVPMGRNAVVSNLDSGVVMIDSSRRILDSNEAVRDFFDFDDTDSIVGREITDVFAEYPGFNQRFQSTADGGDDIDSLVEYDGEYFLIERIPIEASTAAPLGYAILIRDVTEQTRRERRLEETNEQLERFASVISHDLRNPLNVAQGHLDMAIEECQSDHLDTVQQSHDRMATLIDDLLALAREGDHVSEIERVDLNELAQTCWQNVKTKQATIQIVTEGTIRADSGRLQQVLENLFRNAIEHGGEHVTLTIGDTADGFYVEDDGPGIPEEDREEVFDVGVSTSEEGTGFGLSIVREVVTAHGWDITVTEGGGGGARFDITGIETID